MANKFRRGSINVSHTNSKDRLDKGTNYKKVLKK